MINAIIKGIFSLITSLFSAILSPIISLVTGLFPSLSTFFGYVNSFFTMAFTYVRSVLALLCIPDTIIIAYFDYLVILYSIHIVMLAIKFAITIYNKFKL